MKTLSELKVKIFADGADRAGMLEMYQNPLIKGFTTNPTLMRKAGVRDYEAFPKDLVAAFPDRHLSFEVFSDEFDEMEYQARRIASWGNHVYVKIPVSNTKGEAGAPLVKTLARAGVKLNVTAIFTLDQLRVICDALGGRLRGSFPYLRAESPILASTRFRSWQRPGPSWMCIPTSSCSGRALGNC